MFFKLFQKTTKMFTRKILENNFWCVRKIFFFFVRKYAKSGNVFPSHYVNSGKKLISVKSSLTISHEVMSGFLFQKGSEQKPFVRIVLLLQLILMNSYWISKYASNPKFFSKNCLSFNAAYFSFNSFLS